MHDYIMEIKTAQKLLVSLTKPASACKSGFHSNHTWNSPDLFSFYTYCIHKHFNVPSDTTMLLSKHIQPVLDSKNKLNKI